jgi:multidrug transporter EmrE-like cation transporter
MLAAKRSKADSVVYPVTIAIGIFGIKTSTLKLFDNQFEKRRILFCLNT